MKPHIYKKHGFWFVREPGASHSLFLWEKWPELSRRLYAGKVNPLR